MFPSVAVVFIVLSPVSDMVVLLVSVCILRLPSIVAAHECVCYITVDKLLCTTPHDLAHLAVCHIVICNCYFVFCLQGIGS